jgi:hypothetical protein
MARDQHDAGGQKRSRAVKGRRRPARPRPTPRWLTGRTDLDQIAQRRCLMLLSVLSGEKPVTTVVEELGISRASYYQLETKALVAMLTALAPGAEGTATADSASTASRIARLEQKVTHLEQDKRRLERLLYLARRILPQGPVTTGPGRTPNRHSSTSPGRGSSQRSMGLLGVTKAASSRSTEKQTSGPTASSTTGRTPPASTLTTPGASEP